MLGRQAELAEEFQDAHQVVQRQQASLQVSARLPDSAVADLVRTPVDHTQQSFCTFTHDSTIPQAICPYGTLFEVREL